MNRAAIFSTFLYLAAAQTFVGVPQVSPTTVSAGTLVSVTYSLSGGVYPVTAYVVGATPYTSGSVLGGWTKYPLLSSSYTDTEVTGVIPAAAVSTGSYKIVLRTSSGVWSTGADITVVLGASFTSKPSATPSDAYAGVEVTVAYSLSTPAAAVTGYVVGATAFAYGATLGGWTTYPLLSSSFTDSQVKGVISAASVSSGSYYIVLQTDAGVWSDGAPISVAAFEFSGTPSVTPTSVTAGILVTATYTVNIPTSVLAFVVGATAYTSGASLGGWATYPLLNPASTESQVSGNIPAASVSSGSYYIVLRTDSGVWSKGAPIVVGRATIQVSPTTFSPYDSMTTSWAAGAVTYPADVLIVGELLSYANPTDNAAVVLGSVSTGSSLTAVVTLDQVSMGSYLVYLRWPTSTGAVYSPYVPITVQKVAPNPVAVYDRTAAFIALRWAFMAYQTREALESWNSSQVCNRCPACAQTSTATSLVYMEGDSNGAGYLMTTTQGFLVLSFRGTTFTTPDGKGTTADLESDFYSTQLTYMGCGNVTTCSVHAGFYGVYKSLAPYLIEALHAAIPTSQRATTPIVVTGHSLGGAVATIAAYELAAAGYLVRGVYTFGSPRVGNAAFAAAFNMAVARALPQFYDNIQLPPVTANLRRGLEAREGGQGQVVQPHTTWPLRPSHLMLEAMAAQGIFLPSSGSDADFWVAWNENAAGKRFSGMAPSARRLFNTTIGAGQAAEMFRGCWRIGVCSDPFVYLPPENLNFVHVDDLVSVDPKQSQAYQLGNPLSCSTSYTPLNSHYDPSYALSLLSGVDVDNGHIVYLKSSGDRWTNTLDHVDCSAVPLIPSDSPSFSPSTSLSSTSSPTPSIGSSRSPSPSPSPTPSPSLFSPSSPAPPSPVGESNAKTPVQDQTPPGSDTAAIAGGVGGGLVLAMATAGAFVYARSKRGVGSVPSATDSGDNIGSISNPLSNFKGSRF